MRVFWLFRYSKIRANRARVSEGACRAYSKVSAAFLASLLPCLALAQPPGEISARSHGLTATAYETTGWAICSVRYRGVEFIDAADHGRCLQSAVSFDWMGEAFNPTEGGSVRDGLASNRSSSQPLQVIEGKDELATEVRMAFWQGGLSGHILRKWVQVGFGNRPIIEHDIAFEPPANEVHALGQYEILTGYLPRGFSHFRSYDPASRTLAELSDGPGEQALPVIFCTPDDRNCVGALSPSPLAGGGYGRWRFPDCVKWNMVARFTNPKGTYRFRVFSVYGALEEVKAGIDWLAGN
jgi:hypothetical protein